MKYAVIADGSLIYLASSYEDAQIYIKNKAIEEINHLRLYLTVADAKSLFDNHPDDTKMQNLADDLNTILNAHIHEFREDKND